jgi:hypothetical protein
MSYSGLLKRKIGLIAYRKMLARSKPKDEEQWAYQVYTRLNQTHNNWKRKEDAKSSIRAILRRGSPLGEEDLAQVDEWLELLS